MVSQQILRQKHFGSEKCKSKKFGLKQIFGPKSFGSKKVCQRYIFLKGYRFISLVGYLGYQFSTFILPWFYRHFTFKILVSSPDPPNNYFFLPFGLYFTQKYKRELTVCCCQAGTNIYQKVISATFTRLLWLRLKFS